MNRLALHSVVIAVVAILITASAADAKLPFGTTFEACGESGCRVTAGEEILEVGVRLIEPTIEHGDAGAPAGRAPWIRVDIGFSDRDQPGPPRRLVDRGFPVIFVPGADSLGVPRGDGSAYRWVTLSPAATRAYMQVAEGVQPFPPQVLAELNAVEVARTDTDSVPGSAATPGGDDEEPVPLLVVLAAIGLLLAAGLAYRGRQLRHRQA